MKTEKRKGLVSVIIPCFNAAIYLSDAIESVLSQTYRNYEIIVVDDGSIDDTYEVLKRFKNEINYIYKPNGGPASARNLGVKCSSGEYIAFLDADDVWLPHKLDVQIEYLSNNHKIGMIHANMLVSEGNWQPYPFFSGKKPKTGSVFKELFLDNFINNLTVVMRRECFEVVKGLDESKLFIGIEDYDLWLRTSLLYEIGYVDNIVAIYRIHDSNISSERERIRRQFVLVNKYRNELRESESKYHGLFQEKEDRLKYRWACWLLGKGRFNEAKSNFKISVRRKYLKLPSILGILFCFLRINIFFKNRDRAFHLKRYANYQWAKGNKAIAKKYYCRSLMNYFLQIKVIKRLLRV